MALAGGTPGSEHPRHRADRNRGLAKALGVGAVARVLSALAPLALIPMLYSYLGEARFGAWATVLSITSMLVFADLGLASSLLTKLSWAVGKDDQVAGKSYVTAAYAGMIGISALLLIIAAVALTGWRPSEILGLDTASDPGEVDAIALFILVAFCISLPIALVNRAQLALQEGAQSSVWSAAGQLASVPVAWLLIRLEVRPSLVVLGVVAAPLIVGGLNTLLFFITGKGKNFRPHHIYLNRRHLYALLLIGIPFSMTSIFSNVALNSDNIIVAIALGVSDVAILTIASRLFRSMSTLVSLVGMPLWGASGESLARGDIDWIRRVVFRSSLLLTSSTALVSLVIFSFRSELVQLWLNDSNAVTPTYLYLGMAAWSILFSLVTPFFMVQNAAGAIKAQVIGWGAYCGLSIPAKFAAVEVWGLSSLPWIGTLCFAATVVPAAVLGYRRILRLHNTSNESIQL